MASLHTRRRAHLCPDHPRQRLNLLQGRSDIDVTVVNHHTLPKPRLLGLLTTAIRPRISFFWNFGRSDVSQRHRNGIG